MDGEEEEAATVNEPSSEAAESAMAVAGEDAKCEPETEAKPESVDGPVGVLSESEPPPSELAEIVGHDAAGGEEKEAGEGKEEGFERNGITENDLEDEAREEEEDLVCAGEVSVEKFDVAEEIETAREEEAVVGDGSVNEAEMASGKADLADVAAEGSEIPSAKGDFAYAEAEEKVTISDKGDLGDVAAAAAAAAEETVAEGLHLLAEEETEFVSEKGDFADVAAEDADERETMEEGDADGPGEELVMADVAPGIQVEGTADAMAVEEEGNMEETEMEEALTVNGEKVGREEEETDLEEDEDEAEGNDYTGTGDEKIEAEEDEGQEVDAMEDSGAADEAEVEEKQELGRGKRKRGKNVKAPVRAPSRKKTEEDVCFICFDGGELVLCDRRGCPKAYHPSCVNRDDAFFRSKGRWNCGWHLCSSCGKNAYYMCYTCTFSLCKACVKDAVILCVRGNKGFCETCMKTVMLIEKDEGNRNDNVNFDDKSSWEYLFKDYWTDLKEKESLTLSELAEAKNPWKGANSDVYKQESADEPLDTNNDHGSDSDGSSGEPSNSKRRKTRKRAKPRSKEKDSRRTVTSTRIDGLSSDGNSEWASKELLEFVIHMRDGDTSVLSQFDVQALLLEYIKRNKLRDPRRKSQIICDSRLENLFGKPRVGHFEMLKLLESHFLLKEDAHIDDLQGSVVDTEASQLEGDGNSDAPGRSGKDKKRKNRRKSDGKGPQSNLEDYAAIDTHNINLIYLRRNLVEDLIDDAENFHDKAVGAFVRIRISGSNQKQDLYRLVQVVGTCKAAEPYKVGKKMSDICLEILNLNKTEILSMDIISNQEFTEEECKRLRQSIKCGLINRLTVGDVQEKAIALQAVRVKDWLESEIVRLSHLRDRASETGRRKELRECVEKLQLLKTPEERHRRLEEIPEIHTDPNMDPNFESEEEEEADDKRRENFMKSRASSFGRRGREPISPRKGGSASSDAWSGTRNYSSVSPELSRNMSGRGFSNKMEETTGVGEIVNDLWNQGRDRETNSWEKHKMSTLETGSRSAQSAAVHESESSAIATGVSEPLVKINESEKIWHYKDPSGKVQGPFSIVQLRKWNATGYFPPDLRIWRQTEKQEDSILLSDVLAGKLQKEKPPQAVHNLHPSPTHSAKLQGSSLQRALEVQVGVESWRSPSESNSLTAKATTLPAEAPKYSSDGWGTTNLPSPTPSQTPLSAPKVQPYESKWSSSPIQSSASLLATNQFPGNARATRENNSPSPHLGSITPSKPGQIMQLGPASDLPAHHLSTVATPVLTHASGTDITSVVSNLQSLVQSVASHLPPAENQGWVSVSAPKQEMMASTPTPTPGGEPQPWRGPPSHKVEPNNPVMMHGQQQPPAHGQWSDGSSFNTGNTAPNFPTTGFQAAPSSDPWRAPISSNQPSNQPQPQPWGVGVTENQTAPQRMGQENQNSGWGPAPPNPNMGWGGPPVQGNTNTNTNMNWGVPGQTMPPGNTNAGWAPAPNQGSGHGNPVSGWGPPPINNANQGWGGHSQGPAPGNSNPSWGPAPSGNQPSWGNDRSHNTDRYSKNRDMGSQQGGDSGYGGAKPWNRQPSFGGGGGGGGSSRPAFKGQRVCKFHESGHCRKGASCDYLHT